MLRGEADEEELAKCIHFEQFLDRDSNAGFSGCEIKRSELLQLMAQDPDFRRYLLVTDLGIEKDHNLVAGDVLLGRYLGAGKSDQECRSKI